jgi:hypothetical protein
VIQWVPGTAQADTATVMPEKFPVPLVVARAWSVVSK